MSQSHFQLPEDVLVAVMLLSLHVALGQSTQLHGVMNQVTQQSKGPVERQGRRTEEGGVQRRILGDVVVGLGREQDQGQRA